MHQQNVKPALGKKDSIKPKRAATTMPSEANKQKEQEEAEQAASQNTHILEKKVLELKLYIRQLRDKFRVCSQQLDKSRKEFEQVYTENKLLNKLLTEERQRNSIKDTELESHKLTANASISKQQSDL